MTESASQLLSDFARRGWDSSPFERMLGLASSELRELVLGAIEMLPRSPTFVDAALSLITPTQLAACVDRSVVWLTADPRRVSGDAPAEAVIAYASLQDPSLLADHLRTLWDLRPNGSTYYAEWPWRAADEQEAHRLLQVLQAGSDVDRARA